MDSFSPAPHGGSGHPGGWATLILVGAVAALTSACSSSSSNGDAFGDYEGIWRVELGTVAMPASVYTLTCATHTGDVLIWDKLIMEPGTVSDLIETSGPNTCQFPFAADAAKSTASVPASDPLSGAPVTCTTFIGSDPADPVTGAPGPDLYLDLTPNPWTFKVFAPVKGKAPTGQLTGTSAGALHVVDTSTGTATTDNACSYSVLLNLTKIAKD